MGWEKLANKPLRASSWSQIEDMKSFMLAANKKKTARPQNPPAFNSTNGVIFVYNMTDGWVCGEKVKLEEEDTLGNTSSP